MARGMILGLVLFIGSSAWALSDVERCARKADRLVRQEYPDNRVERQEFKNTTPGSYDQEYLGVYLIDGRQIEVGFYSSFICDRLQLVTKSE